MVVGIAGCYLLSVIFEPCVRKVHIENGIFRGDKINSVCKILSVRRVSRRSFKYETSYISVSVGKHFRIEFERYHAVAAAANYRTRRSRERSIAKSVTVERTSLTYGKPYCHFHTLFRFNRSCKSYGYGFRDHISFRPSCHYVVFIKHAQDTCRGKFSYSSSVNLEPSPVRSRLTRIRVVGNGIGHFDIIVGTVSDKFYIIYKVHSRSAVKIGSLEFKALDISVGIRKNLRVESKIFNYRFAENMRNARRVRTIGIGKGVCRYDFVFAACDFNLNRVIIFRFYRGCEFYGNLLIRV